MLPEGFHQSSSGAGRCVEATRVAVAALTQVGVVCRAEACDVTALNCVDADWRAAGAEPPMPTDAWSIGLRCDAMAMAPNLSEPYRRRKGFAGHLVVRGDGWFADLTAQQLHRPEHGVHVLGVLAGEVDEAELLAQAELPHGGLVEYFWRPEIRHWRNTPAWRQDIPAELIRLLVQGVRAVMAGEEPTEVLDRTRRNANVAVAD